MKYKGHPDLKLLVAFLFLISSLVIALTLYPNYRSLLSTPEIKNATFDVNVNISLSASYNGSALSSGDNICIGAISLSSTPTGTYATDATKTVVDIECVDYYGNGTCRGYDTTTPGVPSANINWVSDSTFSTVLNSFAAYSSKCYYSQLTTFSISISSDVTARYFNDNNLWSGDRLLGNGRASMVYFCRGTKAFNYTLSGSESQVSGSSVDVSSIASSTFTPSTGGVYTLKATESIANCSTVVRGWRIYGSGPVRNCLYSDASGTMAGLSFASPSLSLNVYRGPVFNFTSFSAEKVVPVGSNVSFNLTIRNDGDMTMSVSPLGMTFTSGFTLISVTPSSNFTLSAGQSQTLTGIMSAPATAGNYTIVIRMPYQATESILGTCDDANTASSDSLTNSSNTTFEVVDCPIISSSLQILPSIVGEGQIVNFTIYIANGGNRSTQVTSSSDVTFGNFALISLNQAFPVALNPGVTTITGSGSPVGLGSQIVTSTVNYAPVSNCTGGSTSASATINVLSRLTLGMSVVPSGIIRGNSHTITINVTATRSGQSVPPLGSLNYILHRWDPSGSTWLYAPTWSGWDSTTFSFSPSDTETYGEAYVTEGVHYLYAPYPDWEVGVYRVTGSIFDIYRNEYINISRFFVIYSLDNCLDRA